MFLVVKKKESQFILLFLMLKAIDFRRNKFLFG